MVQRPPRSAAERWAQRLRAAGRAVEWLAASLEALDRHRGGRATQEGRLLREALQEVRQRVHRHDAVGPARGSPPPVSVSTAGGRGLRGDDPTVGTASTVREDELAETMPGPIGPRGGRQVRFSGEAQIIEIPVSAATAPAAVGPVPRRQLRRHDAVHEAFGVPDVFAGARRGLNRGGRAEGLAGGSLPGGESRRDLPGTATSSSSPTARTTSPTATVGRPAALDAALARLAEQAALRDPVLGQLTADLRVMVADFFAPPSRSGRSRASAGPAHSRHGPDMDSLD